MSEKMGRAPKVLVVSNQQTTGPLWVFSLQQRQLNVMLEADPTRTLQAEMLTPILLLSPVRSEEYVIETYKAGVDDCILKPVSPSLFQAKVQVWLRRFGSLTVNQMDSVKV